MRIIAGKFKGKKIEFVSDDKTRPTADMVREGLFSKIQFSIAGSNFLDLFAGSGSVGLEALSRGAKKVFFVEKSRENCRIIKNNLKILYGEDYEKTLGEQGQEAHLIFSDYISFLEKTTDYFDFVYIDPPYKSEYYSLALAKIKDKNLISNESIVICEHDKSYTFDLNGYELISQKKYGIKFLSYFVLNKLVDKPQTVEKGREARLGKGLKTGVYSNK